MKPLSASRPVLILASLLQLSSATAAADAVGVSNVEFHDLATDDNVIEGVVSWEPPEDTAAILHYGVWMANDRDDVYQFIENKVVYTETELGNVPIGVNQIDIVPAIRREITNGQPALYFMISANRADWDVWKTLGQAAYVAIYDNSSYVLGDVLVLNVRFSDEDPEEDQVGGLVQWDRDPDEDYGYVSHFSIWLADDENGANQTLLGEVSSTADKFRIPHNVVAETERFILVYCENQNGRATAAAYTTFKDVWSSTTVSTTSSTHTMTSSTSSSATNTSTTSTASSVTLTSSATTTLSTTSTMSVSSTLSATSSSETATSTSSATLSSTSTSESVTTSSVTLTTESFTSTATSFTSTTTTSASTSFTGSSITTSSTSTRSGSTTTSSSVTQSSSSLTSTSTDTTITATQTSSSTSVSPTFTTSTSTETLSTTSTRSLSSTSSTSTVSHSITLTSTSSSSHSTSFTSTITTSTTVSSTASRTTQTISITVSSTSSMTATVSTSSVTSSSTFSMTATTSASSITYSTTQSVSATSSTSSIVLSSTSSMTTATTTSSSISSTTFSMTATTSTSSSVSSTASSSSSTSTTSTTTTLTVLPPALLTAGNSETAGLASASMALAILAAAVICGGGVVVAPRLGHQSQEPPTPKGNGASLHVRELTATRLSGSFSSLQDPTLLSPGSKDVQTPGSAASLLRSHTLTRLSSGASLKGSTSPISWSPSSTSSKFRSTGHGSELVAPDTPYHIPVFTIEPSGSPTGQELPVASSPHASSSTPASSTRKLRAAEELRDTIVLRLETLVRELKETENEKGASEEVSESHFDLYATPLQTPLAVRSRIEARLAEEEKSLELLPGSIVESPEVGVSEDIEVSSVTSERHSASEIGSGTFRETEGGGMQSTPRTGPRAAATPRPEDEAGEPEPQSFTQKANEYTSAVKELPIQRKTPVRPLPQERLPGAKLPASVTPSPRVSGLEPEPELAPEVKLGWRAAGALSRRRVR